MLSGLVWLLFICSAQLGLAYFFVNGTTKLWFIK